MHPLTHVRIQGHAHRPGDMLLHVSSSAQTSRPYQQALLLSSFRPLQHRVIWHNCSPVGNHWLVWKAQAASMCSDAEPCSESWQPWSTRYHCRQDALPCRGHCCCFQKKAWRRALRPPSPCRHTDFEVSLRTPLLAQHLH